MAKKSMSHSTDASRGLVETENEQITTDRQCSLIGFIRSSYYYHSLGIMEEELDLMNKIDRIYTENPSCGSRRIADAFVREEKVTCNRKRIQRLMRIMGIEAIRPKRNPSKPSKEKAVFPYLLRDVAINEINQLWSTDITYIPMSKRFLYLVAVIDWYRRPMLSWEVSSTLDVCFCMNALKAALGKGRALNNICMKRFWRDLKYENIYLNDYQTGEELMRGLDKYFKFYNLSRGHQSLKYRTPAEVYLQVRDIKWQNMLTSTLN